ncbi:MAG: hypothetical protein CM15mP23_09970 [Cryomorphaceae bacterium]|nr:MAG: hypothetical protein CM15mP23_09970 [Cryomorphaceae bacterium]
MEAMQNDNIGYLAVSLRFYKTLFSAPGSSTSSEIPEEEQVQMGLSEGMVRISIGIDNDINRTFEKMKNLYEKCWIFNVFISEKIINEGLLLLINSLISFIFLTKTCEPSS